MRHASPVTCCAHACSLALGAWVLGSALLCLIGLLIGCPRPIPAPPRLDLEKRLLHTLDCIAGKAGWGVAGYRLHEANDVGAGGGDESHLCACPHEVAQWVEKSLNIDHDDGLAAPTTGRQYSAVRNTQHAETRHLTSL